MSHMKKWSQFQTYVLYESQLYLFHLKRKVLIFLRIFIISPNKAKIPTSRHPISQNPELYDSICASIYSNILKDRIKDRPSLLFSIWCMPLASSIKWYKSLILEISINGRNSLRSLLLSRLSSSPLAEFRRGPHSIVCSLKYTKLAAYLLISVHDPCEILSVCPRLPPLCEPSCRNCSPVSISL